MPLFLNLRADCRARYVDYKNITKVIEPGRIIYVDDGVLAFDVLEIVDEKTIKVKCRNNGFISSRKGVNLPNTDVDLPALSEKDKNDLRFGVKNNVDMIFACEWFICHPFIFLKESIMIHDSCLTQCLNQPSSGEGKTSGISARFLVRMVPTSKLLPRSRTVRVSTTLPRSWPRQTVSWLLVVI